MAANNQHFHVNKLTMLEKLELDYNELQHFTTEMYDPGLFVSIE